MTVPQFGCRLSTHVAAWVLVHDTTGSGAKTWPKNELPEEMAAATSRDGRRLSRGESPNEQVVRRKWVWQSESYHVVPWEVDRTAGEYGEPYIARIDLLRNAA